MSLSIQKANFWKRISAYLFDCILTVILIVGIATILSAALGYDKHTKTLESYYTEYEQAYGIDFDITQEDFDNLSNEEQTRFNELSADFTKQEKVLAIYEKLLSLTLIIVGVGAFIGVLAVQFVVPLFFSNGQTLGKKIFGVAVMRSNCVRLTNKVLFIRALFGTYTIETMFPLALYILVYFGVLGSVGVITIGLLLLLQIGVLIGTKYNSSIHDLLADTIVVDMASQKIFDAESDMLAYKKEMHAQEAAKTDCYGSVLR